VSHLRFPGVTHNSKSTLCGLNSRTCLCNIIFKRTIYYFIL